MSHGNTTSTVYRPPSSSTTPQFAHHVLPLPSHLVKPLQPPTGTHHESQRHLTTSTPTHTTTSHNLHIPKPKASRTRVSVTRKGSHYPTQREEKNHRERLPRTQPPSPTQRIAHRHKTTYASPSPQPTNTQTTIPNQATRTSCRKRMSRSSSQRGCLS